MRSKISDQSAVEIRYKRELGASLQELSEEYGISKAEVSGICVGRYHKQLPGPRVRK